MKIKLVLLALRVLAHVDWFKRVTERIEIFFQWGMVYFESFDHREGEDGSLSEPCVNKNDDYDEEEL